MNGEANNSKIPVKSLLRCTPLTFLWPCYLDKAMSKTAMIPAGISGGCEGLLSHNNSSHQERRLLASVSFLVAMD